VNEKGYPIKWLTAKEAAEILDCAVPTLRDYGYSGLVETKKEKGRVYFRADDVLRVASRYPKDSAGRRRVGSGVRRRVSRGIEARTRLDGRTSYYARVEIDGDTRRRTFRSLEAAENWRARELAKPRPEASAPAPVYPVEEKRSIGARFLAYWRTRKTEEVTA